MACEILLLWPRVVFKLQIGQVTRVPYSLDHCLRNPRMSRYPNEVQYCISWEVYQISDILVDEVLYQTWLDILLITFRFNPALVERSLSQYLRWALSIFHACQYWTAINKYDEESLLVNRWSRKNISQSPSIRIKTNSIAQRKDAQPCTICQAGGKIDSPT